MNGLFNDTTRDIIMAGGLVLALVQILLALLYPRAIAPAGAGMRAPAHSRPSPLQSLFSVAVHTDVRSYILLLTLSGLFAFALSLICARSVNLASVRGPLDAIEQAEVGSRGYVVPLLYMSSAFQAIGLSGFAGMSYYALDELDTSTCTKISWTRFLSVLSAAYMLLAVFLLRVADSSVGLQIFAVTQIFALSLAFLFRHSGVDTREVLSLNGAA